LWNSFAVDLQMERLDGWLRVEYWKYLACRQVSVGQRGASGRQPQTLRLKSQLSVSLAVTAVLHVLLWLLHRTISTVSKSTFLTSASRPLSKPFSCHLWYALMILDELIYFN